MKISSWIILFLMLCTNSQMNAQHLYVKSNVLNWVFARPSLGAEYKLTKNMALGIQGSWGNTFWQKESNRPYYTFRALLLDYYGVIKESKGKRYQFRGMVYGGWIERKIFQEEKNWSSDWLSFRTKNGRDFTGEAYRIGVGLSQVYSFSKRIRLEHSMGVGIGRYFKQKDLYYTDEKRTHIGFLDCRFSINFCYAIF